MHPSNAELERYIQTLGSLAEVMPPNIIAFTALEWINANLPRVEQQWIKQFLVATRCQSIPLLIGTGVYIYSGSINEKRGELLYLLGLQLMGEKDYKWLLELYLQDQLLN